MLFRHLHRNRYRCAVEGRVVMPEEALDLIDGEVDPILFDLAGGVLGDTGALLVDPAGQPLGRWIRFFCIGGPEPMAWIDAIRSHIAVGAWGDLERLREATFFGEGRVRVALG